MVELRATNGRGLREITMTRKPDAQEQAYQTHKGLKWPRNSQVRQWNVGASNGDAIGLGER